MLALSKIYPILLRPSPTMAPEDFGVVGYWLELSGERHVEKWSATEGFPPN